MKHLPPMLRAAMEQVRANERLQLGLLLITGLAMAFAWKELHAWRTLQQKRSANVELEIKQARLAQKNDVWVARRQSAEALVKQLEERMSLVSTSGLAQASLQGELRALTTPLGPKAEPTIAMNPATAVEGIANAYNLSGQVSASMSLRQAFGLIAQLESAPSLRYISQADLHAVSNTRSSMTVSAVYRAQEPGVSEPQGRQP